MSAGQNYITCLCQHCDGKIEFDASQLEKGETRTANCPHCHLETVIFVPEQAAPPVISDSGEAPADAQVISIKPPIVVRELADQLKQKPFKIIADLMGLGVFANVDQAIDESVAQKICATYGYRFEVEKGERGSGSPKIWLHPLTTLDVRVIREGTFTFVGQDRVRERIEQALEIAKAKGEPPPHLLLIAPVGSGKSLLAIAMAGYMARITGTKIKAADGGPIEKAGNLAGVLSDLEEGEILILDNIDLLRRFISEYLEPAIADFKLDIVVGHAHTVRLNLPRFTLIATATRKERLSPILLASFPIVEELGEYTAEELTEITYELARESGLEIEAAAADLIVGSTSGNPKEVSSRVRLVGVYARAKTSSKTITAEIVADALRMLPSASQADAVIQGRAAISSEVRREVWRRDGGKCVKCGSRENLEYDHIIPISKGGSNTARNIELLCEDCNRSKRDSIQ